MHFLRNSENLYNITIAAIIINDTITSAKAKMSINPLDIFNLFITSGTGVILSEAKL